MIKQKYLNIGSDISLLILYINTHINDSQDDVMVESWTEICKIQVHTLSHEAAWMILGQSFAISFTYLKGLLLGQKMKAL